MKSSVIELKNVWKTYTMGEAVVHALQGLSLAIRPGEFVAIMGPSGSGKSTCVNMVGCLDLPTSGTVLLDGQDISHLHESELARIRGKKIGFVFQTFNLIGTLTALENVALPMIFQRIPLQKRMEKGKQLLTLVGLSDRANHTPGELSGGQRQRVAIARALANDPEVILADEPTGNLDSATGEKIIQFLRQLHREQHKTIVLVTHDQKLAKMADRIIHIKDGKVQG
ncbi:ABC transporter ATP-binding protein [Candidatus Woesearchaeota archaeon]|nr:ABC transporter ATP-binding protein [Candidatus Woesearchaeota archaeon]